MDPTDPEEINEEVKEIFDEMYEEPIESDDDDYEDDSALSICRLCEKSGELDEDDFCDECVSKIISSNLYSELAEKYKKMSGELKGYIKEEDHKKNHKFENESIVFQLNKIVVSLNSQLTNLKNIITSSTVENKFDLVTKFASEAKILENYISDLESMKFDYEKIFDKENKYSNLTRNNNEILKIDPYHPYDLTFTQILEATIGDQHPKNWSNVVRTVLIIALKKHLSLHNISSLSSINIKAGEHRQNGFTYIPKINLSFQELDANKSWESAFKLIHHLQIDIEVHLCWKEKDKSAFPGRKGIILWNPS